MRIRGEYWAVAAALCFIGLELSVRTAAPYAPANLGSFVRIWPLIVGSWIGTLASRSGREGLALLFKKGNAVLLGCLAVDGVFNMWLGNALKLHAMSKGGIVLTLTAVEVGQLFGTALFVRWWFGHRVSAMVLAGMAVICVGTALASWSQAFVVGWPGVLGISVLAGLCFAASVTAVGYVLRNGVGLWPALSISTSVGLVVAGIVAAVTGQAPTLANIGRIGATGTFFLLLSGVAFACALFFLTGALQRISIVSANAISGANGAAAALVGAVIFGPSVTGLLVVGVVLVAIGAVMVRTRNARDEIEDAPRGRSNGPVAVTH